MKVISSFANFIIKMLKSPPPHPTPPHPHPPTVATRLVLQTILGSTLYAEASTTLHPAELRNSVTSPAGTTASAVYELERGGFRSNVSNAIWACYRRSLEMGGRDSNVGPGRVGELPSGEFGDMK